MRSVYRPDKSQLLVIGYLSIKEMPKDWFTRFEYNATGLGIILYALIMVLPCGSAVK